VNFESINIKESNINGTVFDYKIGETFYKNIKLPLIGTYQVCNCALVLNVIDILRKNFHLSESAITEGIAAVKWPGRFEILHKNPVFIADGGHNPHGIHGTVDSICHHFPNSKIIAIMGVMADKDLTPMLEILAPVVKSVHTVKPNNPRAMEPELLADKFRDKGIKAVSHNEIEKGVAAAFSEATPDDIICALGSFYMYADIADAVKKLTSD